MPLLQAMSARANVTLNRENIANVTEEVRTSPTLVQLAVGLGIAQSEAEQAYLSAWPVSMGESLRALVARAIQIHQPVTLSWAPGYDYSMTVWEAADTDISPGGLTVLLRSRYPGHDPVQGI